ncbi:hypothetical protein EGI31_21505 [Lacihabitans soyangensis]|uniref:Uncharacterized protein n=1 Tax=Lacihabitans soyangensis TaxID=869394 RepID=A0AAE3KXP6_9BACT|nr:hypothetical protein [Lacihabitans soyangensis]
MPAANRQKKHFLCNDPLKNFAFGILFSSEIISSEILQRTAQKIFGTISIYLVISKALVYSILNKCIP